MACMQPERNYFVESDPVEDGADFCYGFSVENFDLSTWGNEASANEDDGTKPSCECADAAVDVDANGTEDLPTLTAEAPPEAPASYESELIYE